MITLNNDTLTFRFPEIGEVLRKRMEEACEARLREILASDLSAAFAAHMRSDWGYRHASTSEQIKMQAAVRSLAPARIERAFRNRAAATIERSVEPELNVVFHRTLRIPDDGKAYPLPPSLGSFPLRHVDDFESKAPPAWLDRGGVMLPMFQAEALWLSFRTTYPMALKVGAGKINAVSGEEWRPGLHQHPQDYLPLPQQPWLDGFCVEKGFIRQFVAMPLGSGYSAEEQITGKGEFGGVQLQAYPIRPEIYFDETLKHQVPDLASLWTELIPPPPQPVLRSRTGDTCMMMPACAPACAAPDMGLGAGGRMRQEIYQDVRDPGQWEQSVTSRCFVHLCNSLVWRAITGGNPPQPPLTAAEYARYGFPWFDHYRDDLKAVEGSSILAKIKSIFQLGADKGDAPLPENESVQPKTVLSTSGKKRPDMVKEWAE